VYSHLLLYILFMFIFVGCCWSSYRIFR